MEEVVFDQLFNCAGYFDHWEDPYGFHKRVQAKLVDTVKNAEADADKRATYIAVLSGSAWSIKGKVWKR